MIELATKAENYAAEKTNEVMVRAIAQAYADGYRDGYKDREEEIPVLTTAKRHTRTRKNASLGTTSSRISKTSCAVLFSGCAGVGIGV